MGIPPVVVAVMFIVQGMVCFGLAMLYMKPETLHLMAGFAALSIASLAVAGNIES